MHTEAEICWNWIVFLLRKIKDNDFNEDIYTVLLRIIFDIFLGAIIQGRHLHEGGVYYKIQSELQFYIWNSMIYSSPSIRKTALYYFISKPHNTPIPVLVQIVEEK